MPDASALQKFQAAFRGELVQPGDPGYDAARKVFNAMIDKRPRAIVYCADAADVMAAVRFGREAGMRVAVRGGGHNAGGLGICDDGLVIDLSRIRNVRVDPAARTIRAGGGSTWGDVDHASHGFGLATPAGVISTTGVGGLTLGGGVGHLTRRFGLTIDNLLEADVVLADGRFVTASSDENEDLFWAIRGGGGNFGIVTSFLFRGHPVETVYAGPMLWDFERTPEVMRWYQDFLKRASTPQDLNGFFAFLKVPPGPPFPETLHGKTMCGVVWCWAGPIPKADEVFRPIRKFGPPALDLVGPLPYPALQSMFDPLFCPGLQSYWKADFVNEISDAAIALHVRNASKLPSPLSTMHMYPIDGAAAGVGNEDTAWAYRDARWAQVIVGVDPDPATAGRLTAWAKAYWDDVHPHSAGGAYVNFMMMDEGEDRVMATYRGNYTRLASIKKKYDPDNFFRVNQNIRPDGR
jgi:FAD/FMN-containing dehydrogenase